MVRRSLLNKAPLLLAAILTALFLGVSTLHLSAAAGTDGEVAITSPSDGAVMSGVGVEVVIELRDRGSRGDHVHLYLDGKLVKPLYGEKVTYTFPSLGHGEHTFTVRLATKGHRLLEAEDSVTVSIR